MSTLRTMSLDLARVEALIRDVISGYALPLEILDVDTTTEGWRIRARDLSHRVLDISIAYTTTARQLRAQIRKRLDTAYGYKVLPN
jgi:hypothetical protein